MNIDAFLGAFVGAAGAVLAIDALRVVGGYLSERSVRERWRLWRRSRKHRREMRRVNRAKRAVADKVAVVSTTDPFYGLGWCDPGQPYMFAGPPWSWAVEMTVMSPRLTVTYRVGYWVEAEPMVEPTEELFSDDPHEVACWIAERLPGGPSHR